MGKIINELPFRVLEFPILDFCIQFVSNFDIRISDLFTVFFNEGI